MEDINIEITLKVKICYNGHAYAVPYIMADSDFECPVCSVGELRKLKEDRARMENVIRGLRGENTKLRRLL